jgi:hypothetical protein
MTLLVMLLACGENATVEAEPTTPTEVEAPAEEPAEAPAEEPTEEAEEATDEVPTLDEAPQLGAPKLGAGGGLPPLGGGPPRLGGAPMQPGGLKAPSLGGGSAPKKSGQ